jgi:hypothetical protein
MTLRHALRPLLALVTAYAVALQTVLLVLVSAPQAVAADLAGPSICVHSGGNGTGLPASKGGCDCLANCLAGCCGTAVAPVPSTATLPSPALMGIAVIRPTLVPPRLANAAVAHRSRAPPLG